MPFKAFFFFFWINHGCPLKIKYTHSVLVYTFDMLFQNCQICHVLRTTVVQITIEHFPECFQSLLLGRNRDEPAQQNDTF